MQNRINKELQELATEPLDGTYVGLIGDSIYNWRVIIEGPSDSAYTGGRFELLITLPQNYPFRPPEVRFMTKIYHVNVNKTDGSLCADIFQNNWAPTLKMRYVIESIISILSQPAPEHAVEPEIASQMLNNPTLFYQKAQEWVRDYAS